MDFEIIAEKISTSSRASFAKLSRELAVSFVRPASMRRRKSRLSFASFLQIFTRIRKSFLLRASSASIQFAATDPEARTNWRTSSVLLIFRGSVFTKIRTAWEIEMYDLQDRVWGDFPRCFCYLG